MAQIEQLRHLVAVVEHGGFRRAAEAIHLSQPALTKSIQRLEASFGVQLIDRSGRRPVPTPFGEIVIEGAKRVLADLDQTYREVDLLKGFEMGVLEVGCDPLAATEVLGPALARLVREHPKIRYEVEVGNWSSLREKLLDRRIDLHVGASPEIHDREVVVTEFTMEPVVFFCRPGHPLTQLEKVTVKELRRYPRIGIEGPPEWNRMYAKVLGAIQRRAETVHPRFAMTDSWSVLKSIVQRSDTISGGPRSVVEADLAAGLLVEFDPGLPPFRPRGSIAHLKDRILPPAAEALVQEILAITSKRRDGEGR